MLPVAPAATVTAAILGFVYYWQDFLDQLVNLSDFTRWPISLGLRTYPSTAGIWVNLPMAAGLIAFVSVAVVSFLRERHVMSGLEC